MTFSFQYYVGQIRRLNQLNHQGLPIYNQFLPDGSHHQTTNKDKFDHTLDKVYADKHILGKNHVNNLNQLVRPLYGFRLIDENNLIATLEDKSQLLVSLIDGVLKVNKITDNPPTV